MDEQKRLLDYLLKVFSIQSECFEVLMMLNQLGRTVVRQVLLWSGKDELTLVFLVFWRLQKLHKLHIDVKLNPQQQSDLQEHELELPNT